MTPGSVHPFRPSADRARCADCSLGADQHDVVTLLAASIDATAHRAPDFETWRRQASELRESAAEERTRIVARLAELDRILTTLDVALGARPALAANASLPGKIAHVLRSVDRPLKSPEIYDLLKALVPGLVPDAMHSAIYRMTRSTPPQLISTGARPRRTYALPSREAAS